MSRPFCLLIEEAKTKWCPQARTAWAMNPVNGDAPVCSANRGHTDDDCRCLADGCMAWRFVDTHIKNEAGDFTIKSGDTHGFCGLAGNPR